MPHWFNGWWRRLRSTPPHPANTKLPLTVELPKEYVNKALAFMIHEDLFHDPVIDKICEQYNVFGSANRGQYVALKMRVSTHLTLAQQLTMGNELRHKVAQHLQRDVSLLSVEIWKDKRRVL